MDHECLPDTLPAPDTPFELPDYVTVWDTNLRANLRLWPVPSPIIESLVQRAGCPYDEAAFLALLPQSPGRKTPQTTRSIRNTFEVLAYAGLAYRDGTPEKLFLTPMGECLFSFLGTVGERRFANDANVPLLGGLLIRALSLLVEARVIWAIMRRVDNRLTNEELNRSIRAVTRLSDTGPTAERILAAREARDPTLIGPREYENEKYGTVGENEQRKAINPRFLLAGGGGMFITVSKNEDERRLAEWAVPIIDTCLAEVVELEHAATRRELAVRMSRHAGPPVDIRGA